MPTKDFCIDAVAEAAGISRSDAAGVVDDLLEQKRALEADGTIASADQIGKIADRLGNDAKLAASLQRKNAALSVIKRQEGRQRIENLVDDGLSQKKALLALIEGSAKRGTRGGSLSAYSFYESVSNKYTVSMSDSIDQIGGGVWDRIRQDADFNEKVVQELWEIRTDGKGNPGVSGDKQAVAVAEVLSAHAEDIRLRLNANGAYIRRLQGWSPQSHDHGKIIKAGFEGWSEFVEPRLDLEAMGVSPAEKNDFLESVYRTLTIGKDTPTIDIVTPRNIARKYGKSRVLHFKSAQDQLAYNSVFGNGGNVVSTIASHIDWASRDIALMETFGPNPEATIISLAEGINKTTQKGSGKINIDGIKRRRNAIGMAFAEVSGETMTAENITAASVGRVWRGIQSLSKLGGASLSAIADAGFFAVERRTTAGKSALTATAEAFSDIFKRASEADRQAASRLAVVTDASLDVIQRFNAQDSAQGVVGNAMAKMFKWTGLTGWTNARKNGFAVLLSKDLGEAIGTKWGDLGDHFQETLKQFGNISEKEWDALGSIGPEVIIGEKFFTPELVSKMSDESLSSLYGIEKGETAAINRARVNLETKLRSMFIETTRNAVIEPDAKTRRWMVWGTKPGTVVGEVLRTTSQFSSFPIAYTQRMLAGRRFNKAGKNADIVGLSMLLSNGIALGYLSMTLKDLAKGKQPRDPRKKETMLAALLQSGGAGIYGDFLFGRMNRFGGSFAGTVGGPTLGTLESLANIVGKLTQGEPDIGADLLQLAKSNTPFANMWFVKPAIDYMVWYNLQEMVSPGSLRRMERRMKKDYNQEYIFPPSNTLR